MIVKSYEIQKKTNNFLKYKLFLLYGENYGLKKDIKESIKLSLKSGQSGVGFLVLPSSLPQSAHLFHHAPVPISRQPGQLSTNGFHSYLGTPRAEVTGVIRELTINKGSRNRYHASILPYTPVLLLYAHHCGDRDLPPPSRKCE